MEIISGKIVAWERGYITIRAPYDNTERFIRREYEEVEIGLKDGRKITPEQRRKAYALMGEISEWAGYEPEELKEIMKHEFLKKVVRSLEKELSHPARGEWIEIAGSRPGWRCPSSHPARGEWIEIGRPRPR